MSVGLISFLYSFFGAGVALSYVPQILATWRDKGAASAISIPAWSFWTVNSGIALLYAFCVAQDRRIAFAALCTFLGCAITTSIAIYKRLNHRSASDAT